MLLSQIAHVHYLLRDCIWYNVTMVNTEQAINKHYEWGKYVSDIVKRDLTKLADDIQYPLIRDEWVDEKKQREAEIQLNKIEDILDLTDELHTKMKEYDAHLKRCDDDLESE